MIRRPPVARRVPRKIGQDEDDVASGDSQSEANGQNDPISHSFKSALTFQNDRLTLATESVVKRPVIANRPKKTSALRMSFGPGAHDDSTGEDEGSAVVKPQKKKPLGRLAVERHAERTHSSEDRPRQDHDRPSYSKDYLEELKQSTPSTPQNFSDRQTSEEVELDTALTKDGNPIILSEAEIRERKERRARLAAEQRAEEYISLDDDNQYLDDESGQLVIRPTEKYTETRLVHEDEDILEGFEDFTEDGKLHLGRKAEREAKKKKRREMEEAIAAAEGGDEDMDEGNSEAERNAAYNAVQTRKGTYGLHKKEENEYKRPRTPPTITPVPPLSDVTSELRAKIDAKRTSIAEKKTRREMLQRSKQEIEENEKWIQEQLNTAAEQYEKLKLDDGPPVNGSGTGESVQNNTDANMGEATGT